MQFEFATATRIVFRWGAIADLPSIARSFGRRVLVVTGKHPERLAPVTKQLADSGLSVAVFSTAGEPTLDAVRAGVQQARNGCEVVVGIGGGSAIDAAKAIAALTANSGEPLDYLEIIGQGQPLEKKPLPFLAVPTTAGAGAEVTRNAVLGAPDQGVKASLRSPLLLAKVALIDPALTVDLPPAVTAQTGLDTLTQLIEPFTSVKANPLTDAFCRDGMPRVADSLLTAYREGGNRAARESMAFASLCGGLSLANAGLGVVHGFAAPLGGMLQDAPHGALCAAVLPHAIAVNLRALRARDGKGEALARYREAATLLTGDSETAPEALTSWITDLCAQLGVTPLGSYGLREEQISELVEKAAKANSMKGNPIVLTTEELREIAWLAL